MQYQLEFEIVSNYLKKKKTSSFYGVAKEEMTLYGRDHLDLQQLLALIIGNGASPVVTGVLASIGIQKLSQMSIRELKELEGVSETIAIRIYSIFEIVRRHSALVPKQSESIRCPEDAADQFWYLNNYQQEHFAVAFLDTKNKVISRKDIFTGSLNASIVHPREVFREAVKVSAASIICAHQHPSGDPSPSQEDIQVTKRLKEAGTMMGIEILDHIIIGNPKYISLKEKGYL